MLDLMRAYGNDSASLLLHTVNDGMREYRAGGRVP